MLMKVLRYIEILKSDVLFGWFYFVMIVILGFRNFQFVKFYISILVLEDVIG